MRIKKGGTKLAIDLVLSLFPGIGLLDIAFEEAGFCIVRGPDVLWGGDVRRFHPPTGKFEGIIGGPPCQAFSALRHLVHARGNKIAESLIPEFERCVDEAQPAWFLMENVKAAPGPVIPGYSVKSVLLNNRWFGAVQNRVRRFFYGLLGDDDFDLNTLLEGVALQAIDWKPTVCASGGRRPRIPGDRATRAKYLGYKTLGALKESLSLQGLPEDFLSESPFTLQGKHKVIGNGVPLPMGRAVAKAVCLQRNLERREHVNLY